MIIPREARAEGPSVARLINLSGRAGPSGAKAREFERKIYLYIYMFISLKVSALLLSHSEKQSMNDVRLSGVVWSKICIHRKKYACMIKFQLQCSSTFTGYRTMISPEYFPFLLEIFFVKDCIEEITRFVAAVK